MADSSKPTLNYFDAMERAREQEETGNLEEAAKLYEAVIKEDKAEELPFNRLMIIYRKLKRYKDELRVINKGVRVFEDFYRKSNRQVGTQKKKLTDLSNAFMKTSGLQDKKGRLVYQPEPIAKWVKRRAVVEKKLK